jgi:hypothetical protein
MNPFFQKVVVTTGISELFAANAIVRACERAGVNPEKLSPVTLKVALPEIERTVRTFCHHEVDQIMPLLHLLLRQDSAVGSVEGSPRHHVPSNHSVSLRDH